MIVAWRSGDGRSGVGIARGAERLWGWELLNRSAKTVGGPMQWRPVRVGARGKQWVAEKPCTALPIFTPLTGSIPPTTIGPTLTAAQSREGQPVNSARGWHLQPPFAEPRQAYCMAASGRMSAAQDEAGTR